MTDTTKDTAAVAAVAAVTPITADTIVTPRGRTLSAADLFAGGTPKPTPIEIPEIPDPENGAPSIVYIRAMSARDVLSLAVLETKTVDEQQSAMIQILVKSIVNPDGTPMFSSESDVEQLRNLSFKVFNRLTNAVNEVAGVTRKDAAGKE